MLPLGEKDRVRILSAVAKKGGMYSVRRVVVITLSLVLLLAVPLLGLARVDVWGGHHELLGESVDLITGLKGVIVAIALLYGVTFLTNVVVGRFFCGWGCPVGYVSRLGEDVDLKKKQKKGRGLAWFASHLAGAGFVATFIAAVMLWWVDWRVVLDGSPTARGVTAAVFLVLCMGGWMHAFVWRFGFCLHVCPIGLYYRYVTSHAPIGIVFNEVPSPCIECGACEKICPVDLDPKRLGEDQPVVEPGRDADAARDDGPALLRYGDAECIRCGDCVEACDMIFSVRKGETPPLRFGRTSDSEAPRS